jgi:thioesterase domain-containing protein
MTLLTDLNPKIKDERYKRPLIFVSDLLGSEASFVYLAAAYDQLDPERFIYGLRSPFLEQNGKEPQSIEELATMYIAALVKIYPYNSFLLCGYSFGGIVALEMARQLQAQKKQINFFGCIDTDLNMHLADLDEEQAALQLLKMAELLVHKFNLTHISLPTAKELGHIDLPKYIST